MAYYYRYPVCSGPVCGDECLISTLRRCSNRLHGKIKLKHGTLSFSEAPAMSERAVRVGNGSHLSFTSAPSTLFYNADALDSGGRPNYPRDWERHVVYLHPNCHVYLSRGRRRFLLGLRRRNCDH